MGTDGVEVNAPGEKLGRGPLWCGQGARWRGERARWRGRLAPTAGQSGDALEVAALGLIRQSPRRSLAALGESVNRHERRAQVVRDGAGDL